VADVRARLVDGELEVTIDGEPAPEGVEVFGLNHTSDGTYVTLVLRHAVTDLEIETPADVQAVSPSDVIRSLNPRDVEKQAYALLEPLGDQDVTRVILEAVARILEGE
jgi:hypothetical protein